MNDTQLVRRDDIGEYSVITIIEGSPMVSVVEVHDGDNKIIFYESRKWSIDTTPEEHEDIKNELATLHEKLVKMISMIVNKMPAIPVPVKEIKPYPY